jgi:HK97 family phage portal protein
LETASGNVFYKYKGKEYEYWEMLHFKDLSLDGIRGVSKIRYNQETVGYSKQLRKFGSNAVGTRPPGYFSTEAPYQTIKNQEEGLQGAWTENIAAGKTPFLPFGMKYFPLMITPNDAQYLDAIGATKEEITAIFRTPPTLIQDYGRATFANAEQQDLVFVKYTMLPVITNIEQECNAKAFPEANKNSDTPFYVKGNVNAFLRGDFKTQTEGFKTLFQNGMISLNQVAELMDWPKLAEGGDERYIPMNLISLTKYNDFIDKLTAPVNTNAGNDGGSDNSERSETFQGIIYNNSKKNGHPVNGHAN